MEISIKIDQKFNNLNINQILDYFHLGKEKRKNLSINYPNNHTFKTGEELKISYSDSVDFTPYQSKLDIVYEDEYLLVVNKKRGLLVHPDNVDNNDTLANMVAYYYIRTKQDISVRYLGRLDRYTTGLVIFVKDILTMSYLSYQVENNNLHRVYRLIAYGKFKNLTGEINFPIARDRHDAKKMRVSTKSGKEALTYYSVLKYLGSNMSYVEAKLKTGRTHQIRLHMMAIGHPIIGDNLYNNHFNNENLMLHSYEVNFVHPISDKNYHLVAELPIEFKKLIGNK